MHQYAEIPSNKAGVRPMKAAIHLAFAAVAFVSLPAFATLGGNSVSVTADQTALQASMSKSEKTGYTDYALTLANGIIVHEFVNSANQVFEVTWNGKGMRPDMKQILGSYFSRFGTNANATQSAQKNEQRPTTRHVERVGANFEMHSAVHNRLFSGTAHIPSMIPTSLSGPLSVPAESVTPSTK
ncbi:MAG TPA: DUF2844 domain-containing protein [Burkholderiaceae bacterium]|jgi:hypothetical protein|nr:DUF2844 domain-containing protein [Burkholderiaceae bacterium]